VDRDAEQLRKLGYAQQLLRDMGGFANFALSFSIISILTGAVTLYGHGLRYGGPLQMLAGWPLVTLLTLPIAMSLAELASAYPTAGALYHWSSWLGGRGAGFFTAWLNTIGQFAITAGIDYGLAEFLAAMLGFEGRTSTLLLCAAILASHAVLNHLGVRLVARLNDLSAWVHIVGVAVIVGALAFFAPHQPRQFLLQRSGGPFAVGLLLACWTFTGYDASAHASEETHDPSRNAPWGMVLAVAVSGVAGYALLLAVTLSIGDLGATTAADNPFIFALRGALGGRTGSALDRHGRDVVLRPLQRHLQLAHAVRVRARRRAALLGGARLRLAMLQEPARGRLGLGRGGDGGCALVGSGGGSFVGCLFADGLLGDGRSQHRRPLWLVRHAHRLPAAGAWRSAARPLEPWPRIDGHQRGRAPVDRDLRRAVRAPSESGGRIHVRRFAHAAGRLLVFGPATPLQRPALAVSCAIRRRA
jgi:hypothetical protein